MSPLNNYSNITDAPVVSNSSSEDQDAYDQLDPRIRAFISSAPEKLSSIWALQMQQKLGVEDLLRSGKEMLARRYPGWTPK